MGEKQTRGSTANDENRHINSNLVMLFVVQRFVYSIQLITARPVDTVGEWYWHDGMWIAFSCKKINGA